MTELKSEQINLRLPKPLVKAVEEMAEAEHLDRAAAIRKLLAEGVDRYRLDRAMRLYVEGRVTKSRAAEMAGISLYEILDEIERRGLRSPHTASEVHEDLELLRQRHSAR